MTTLVSFDNITTLPIRRNAILTFLYRTKRLFNLKSLLTFPSVGHLKRPPEFLKNSVSI